MGVEQRKGVERGWEDRKEEKLGQDVKEKKNFFGMTIQRTNSTHDPSKVYLMSSPGFGLCLWVCNALIGENVFPVEV